MRRRDVVRMNQGWVHDIVARMEPGQEVRYEKRGWRVREKRDKRRERGRGKACKEIRDVHNCATYALQCIEIKLL